MSQADAPTTAHQRLPRTVTPERYELSLTPDLTSARFTGEQRVQVKVHEATDTIVVNANELQIFEAELIDAAGNQLPATIDLDAVTETATFRLESPLQPGDWILHTTFAGELNDKLCGFYRSTFTDAAGNEQVIATTQFEATDARRAFPCWDEPDFKAVFAITLIVDDELAAFSNGAIKEETPLDNGKRQVEFVDTMKMSTYIVAFVVGPLVTTETVDVDGVPLRVACVPGQQHLTSFALEIGAHSLRFFSDYFGIPYPGGKLDMLALPDFAAGAMENLGCVTFRETALLVEDNASRLEKERVADVVAHEIAHMWFGDLVTMKWWNGLWLNEAFATFMEKLCVDNFRPEWERWVSFGQEQAAAMDLDGLASTRPIEFTVNSPSDAAEMFDLLTYEKGGGVLRMLEQHIGPDTFRKGVSNYLRDNAYGNAETTDLWDALDAVSDEPVRAMMDSWIFQGGHPVVRAEVEGSQLTLTQRHFTYLPNDSQTRWHVPVSVRSSVVGTIESKKQLFNGESTTFDLGGKPEWVVVNEHSNGFYPVSYSSSLLGLLSANIDQLDALERFSLANDSWDACVAGDVELPDVIKLIHLLRGDLDPNVWGSLMVPLRSLDFLVDDSLRPNLKSLVLDVAKTRFDELGWTPAADEKEQIGELRALAMGAAGGLGGDEAVRAEVAERFARYEGGDATALAPALVSTAQRVLAATNQAEHWERLRARFERAETSPQHKVIALQCLASFTDPSLLERTRTMILNEQVRSQDAPYAVRAMIAKRETGLESWKWLEHNWEWMLKRFPDNSIDRMVDGAIYHYDPEYASAVKTFLDAHPLPYAQKSFNQTLERLTVNQNFAERNRALLPSLFD